MFLLFSVLILVLLCLMSFCILFMLCIDFFWFDEWYNFRVIFRFLLKESMVLVLVDLMMYEGWIGLKGDEVDGFYFLVWCYEVEIGGMRVFYMVLGYFDDVYVDVWFMGMLERVIWWIVWRGK